MSLTAFLYTFQPCDVFSQLRKPRLFCILVERPYKMFVRIFYEIRIGIDETSSDNMLWVLSRSSFLLKSLGSSSLELLLKLRFEASSDVHPGLLSGTSHLLWGTCPFPDLGVAWIWGKTFSFIASLIALWNFELTKLMGWFILWVILWINFPDSLLNSLLDSVSLEF